MCSSFEAGSDFMRIDFVCHSTLSLRATKKKKIPASGSRVWGFAIRCSNFGVRLSNLRFRDSGPGFATGSRVKKTARGWPGARPLRPRVQALIVGLWHPYLNMVITAGAARAAGGGGGDGGGRHGRTHRAARGSQQVPPRRRAGASRRTREPAGAVDAIPSTQSPQP